MNSRALRPQTVARAQGAWSQIAKLPELPIGFGLLIDDDSRLGPKSGIDIFVLADTRLVVIPNAQLEEWAQKSFATLDPTLLLDPDVVLPLLPPIKRVVGPATLAFADAGSLQVADVSDVRMLDHDSATVQDFLRFASSDDLSESGLADNDGPFYAIVEDDRCVAAASYEIWENTLAHIGLLVNPSHRGRGLGKRVGLAASRSALAAGLVPQWRARPVDSREVARAIGFVELGGQLSFAL